MDEDEDEAGDKWSIVKKEEEKGGCVCSSILVIGDVKMFCHSRFHSNALLKYVINFAIQCTIHKCLHHFIMLIDSCVHSNAHVITCVQIWWLFVMYSRC